MNKKKYLITDFGAKTNDRLQTEAIQTAIDTCFLNGGGRVIIPCGRFLSGGLRLRSNVELYLESGAILKGSTDPEDYNSFINDTLEPIAMPDPPIEPPLEDGLSRWYNGFIRAFDAKNIAITGETGSYIDGSNVYDGIGEENYRGPHAICVWNCDGINLNGYTVIDSANWAHAIFLAKNITARNITVLGGHDGFDVRTCDNILIEDCIFRTGDDSIAGFDNNDVVIRNCILDSACSALRFGGNNVVIENCKGEAPGSYAHRGFMSMERRKLSELTSEGDRRNMLNAFLYYCDFRAEIRKTPGDIFIRNCDFENPDAIIKLEFNGKHRWCLNRSLSSITFENCRFTGLAKTSVVYGDKKEPITLTLKNVEISVNESYGEKPIIDLTNFDRLELSNVTVKGISEPTVVIRSEGETVVENCTSIRVLREFGEPKGI